MADDLEARLAGLRKRAEDARQAQARAEHQRDEAQAALARTAAALESEFGVTTFGEARELLGTLREEIKAEAARIEEALERAGG